jgi:choline dehydrogenase-like flavoprotein
MFNAVGGSTHHWTGHFPRFHPSDFRVKTLDGAGADWPISYQDLEPYYDMNDAEMGVSGIAGDPANPPRKRRPTPCLPMGNLGETIARGFDKLGWYWWPSDNAIISKSFDGRAACDLEESVLSPPRAPTPCPIGQKRCAKALWLNHGLAYARSRSIKKDMLVALFITIAREKHTSRLPEL